MRIILDNIIFKLQVSGGISNYWYQWLNYLIKNPSLQLMLFEDRSSQNIFRKLLNLSDQKSLGHQNIPALLGRYINPKLKSQNKKAIFHSSYYRTSQNSNHINITTVHDFTYEKYIKGPRTMVHKTQKRQAVINSKGIICISENTKKDLLRIIPESKNKKIAVIPHGVSSKDFHSLDSSEKELNKLSKFQSKSYLVYVGDRKSSYKNFESAVVTAKTVKTPLLIVGGGPLTANETNLLKEVPHEYHGRVDNKTLNLIYNNAFALIYPSAYEGFGLPVVEAQMAGCPVIALNSSSIPEVVEDTALLVQRDNKVDGFVACYKKLENENTRIRLITKGLENAKRFTWEKTFEKTLEFYEELYQL